jgi:hypothetical protein
MHSVFKGGRKKILIVGALLSISTSLNNSISPKEIAQEDELNRWRGGSKKKGGKTKWPKR